MRPALAGAALAVVSTVSQGQSDPQLKGFSVGGSVLILALWGVGRLAHSRERMVSALRARTAELHEQRDRTARLAVAGLSVRPGYVLSDGSFASGERLTPAALAGCRLEPELCLVIGDRLTVRPPWEPPSATALDVVIDPGQAFGTGAHATTRLCLELMLDTAAAGSFVDLGCGSGVLAIVAAKLGWPAVTALDYDKAATVATRENAHRNRVELEVVDFDLRYEQVPDADLVAANVLAAPLVGWAASQRRLAPRLILSGLLASEADRVAAAFAQRGRHEHARRVLGEWAALALRGE